MTLLDFDRQYRETPVTLIAGSDEAGRGPLAGPVTAAAVVFPPETEPFHLVRDSKKLSETQREEAYEWIMQHALSWSVKSLGVSRIHDLNILNAALEAMARAVESLDPKPDTVLIDGNRRPPRLPSAVLVTGGDRKSFAIAAASILAKVSRDRLMQRWAEIYPGYGLEKHKGYGTAAHLQALDNYLPLPIHRRDFGPVRDFAFPEHPDPKTLGRWGENWAIYHLIRKGYTFVDRHVTLGHLGEIDAIFKKEELFVFVEVKTRGSNNPLDAAEWIDEPKINRLCSLAERYFETKEIEEYEMRLDAVIVECRDWFEPRIRHYENILEQ